mmetsp:Transcript_36336/g.69702  ORF Transcript_36336/g.69702 Transcript_36336/m.69702 type:complete len:675 (-) Transcript_36336:553-2577(-)
MDLFSVLTSYDQQHDQHVEAIRGLVRRQRQRMATIDWTLPFKVEILSEADSTSKYFPARNDQCPEKFFAALLFIQVSHPSMKETTLQNAVKLEALTQAVCFGSNMQNEPEIANFFEHEVWVAHKQLGSLTEMEAMQLYLMVVEEDNPGWWAIITRNSEANQVREMKLDILRAAIEFGGGPTAVTSALEVSEEVSQIADLRDKQRMLDQLMEDCQELEKEMTSETSEVPYYERTCCDMVVYFTAKLCAMALASNLSQASDNQLEEVDTAPASEETKGIGQNSIHIVNEQILPTKSEFEKMNTAALSVNETGNQSKRPSAAPGAAEGMKENTIQALKEQTLDDNTKDQTRETTLLSANDLGNQVNTGKAASSKHHSDAAEVKTVTNKNSTHMMKGEILRENTQEDNTNTGSLSANETGDQSKTVRAARSKNESETFAVEEEMTIKPVQVVKERILSENTEPQNARAAALSENDMSDQLRKLRAGRTNNPNEAARNESSNQSVKLHSVSKMTEAESVVLQRLRARVATLAAKQLGGQVNAHNVPEIENKLDLDRVKRETEEKWQNKMEEREDQSRKDLFAIEQRILKKIADLDGTAWEEKMSGQRTQARLAMNAVRDKQKELVRTEILMQERWQRRLHEQESQSKSKEILRDLRHKLLVENMDDSTGDRQAVSKSPA